MPFEPLSSSLSSTASSSPPPSIPGTFQDEQHSNNAQHATTRGSSRWPMLSRTTTTPRQTKGKQVPLGLTSGCAHCGVRAAGTADACAGAASSAAWQAQICPAVPRCANANAKVSRKIHVIFSKTGKLSSTKKSHSSSCLFAYCCIFNCIFFLHSCIFAFFEFRFISYRGPNYCDGRHIGNPKLLWGIFFLKFLQTWCNVLRLIQIRLD